MPPMPPTAPPPRSSRTLVIAVVAAVVVIVVVIAALWAGGVGPFSKSSTGGSVETLATASGQAQSAADGQSSGGSWTLESAVGFLAPVSGSENISSLSALASESGCTFKWASGAPQTISVSGSSVSPSSGEASAWIFSYYGSSEILDVWESGGSAYALFSLSGGDCALLSDLTVSSSSSTPNSASVAAAAWADGGSAFASNHTGGVSTTYDYTAATSISVDGFTDTTPGSWTVSLSNCNDFASTASTFDGKAGSTFSVDVNVTTTIATDPTVTPTTCSSGISGLGGSSGGSGGSGGSSVAFSSNAEASFPFETNNSAGTYYNNGSLIVFGSGITLTLGELTVSIENASTGSAVSTSGFSLAYLNIETSAVDATYDFTSNTWSDASLAVGSTYEFELVTPHSMAGDQIVFTASSSAPVTGSVSSTIGSQF